MQVPLTRKYLQATSPTPSTGSRLHNKEKPQTASLQKRHSKHSNLNKMKKQRNIQQVKEHDKCPPNQTKEEEMGSLPEIKFRINDSQFRSVQSLSRVRLFATPWITERQASLSITISRSSLRLTYIKSVMPSSHLIPVRMAAIQKSTNNKCWRGCGEKGTLTLLVGMQTSTATMENRVEIP